MSKNSVQAVWYLQLRDPQGDAHRLVVFKSKDKGECKRLMRRIMKANGIDGSHYMINKYYDQVRP